MPAHRVSLCSKPACVGAQAPRKPQEGPPSLPAPAASVRKAPRAPGSAAGTAAAARDPSGGEPSGPEGAQQGAEGATVFVRGLPLDASQFAVQDRMARFGRVQACRWAARHRGVVLLVCCVLARGSMSACAVTVLAVHPVSPCRSLSVWGDMAGWCWTSRRASQRALPSWNFRRLRPRKRLLVPAPRLGVRHLCNSTIRSCASYHSVLLALVSCSPCEICSAAGDLQQRCLE